MKTGMNLLLWTDHVTEAQDVIVDQIKVLGFDAVEVPVFATAESLPRRDGPLPRRPGLHEETRGLNAAPTVTTAITGCPYSRPR